MVSKRSVGPKSDSYCAGGRWRLWREKCHDDSETKNWLTAHTKPCPKCGKPVEKNGGCNLVMCVCRQVRARNARCRALLPQSALTCLSPSVGRPHNPYSCFVLHSNEDHHKGYTQMLIAVWVCKGKGTVSKSTSKQNLKWVAGASSAGRQAL